MDRIQRSTHRHRFPKRFSVNSSYKRTAYNYFNLWALDKDRKHTMTIGPRTRNKLFNNRTGDMLCCTKEQIRVLRVLWPIECYRKNTTKRLPRSLTSNNRSIRNFMKSYMEILSASIVYIFIRTVLKTGLLREKMV